MCQSAVSVTNTTLENARIVFHDINSALENAQLLRAEVGEVEAFAAMTQIIDELRVTSSRALALYSDFANTEF